VAAADVPSRIAAWLAPIVLLLLVTAGCFGGPRRAAPGLAAVQAREFSSLELGPAWLVTPREGDGWQMRVTPWTDTSMRIEIEPKGGEFRPGGLDDYGFIVHSPGHRQLTSSVNGGELLLRADDLVVRVGEKNHLPYFYVGGKGPFWWSGVGSKLLAQATPTERFYGMGEIFGGIEHRNKTLTANLRYGVNDQSHLSATPFYMSSAGYGLLWDTTYATEVDFAKTDPTAVVGSTLDPHLRVLVFDGPRFTSILQDLSNVTGKPTMPPQWMFGFIQSKFGYFDRTQLEEVARRLRAEDYPADSLVLDYFWRDNARMVWNEAHWPAHQQMLDALHALGFKVIVHEDTEQMRFYPDAPAGYRYATERTESPGLQILDVSNQDAVQWYWTSVHRPLMKEVMPGALAKGGVDGFWLDEIDWAPETGTQPFKNGMLPAEMHNLYANLFTKAVAKPMIDDLQTRPVIITRSYWTGGQRFPTVWSGDTATTFEQMQSEVHAGLSMGLSGFAFWGDDLGGFWGKPSDDLHIRWAAQFGAFMPFMRIHGTGTLPINFQTAFQSREPWDYGAKAQSTFRDFDKLRYRLNPYVYSIAHDAAATGLPMMRALVLDYQDDPHVARLANEYLFGPAFLVSPIASGANGVSATNQTLYLPKGTWYDYWSDAPTQGGITFDWNGPLERFPVFVKAGAIVPMGPDQKFVGEKPVDPLTIHVWPQARGSFRLVEDDGKSLAYAQGAMAQRLLTAEPTKSGAVFHYPLPTGSYVSPARAVQVVFHDVAPKNVLLNGVITPSAAQGRTVTVNVAAGQESFTIELQ
jgi:alpha-glucosidase (family GH31 glycosyl hydrolase)